jgi:hypothetical protein
MTHARDWYHTPNRGAETRERRATKCDGSGHLGVPYPSPHVRGSQLTACLGCPKCHAAQLRRVAVTIRGWAKSLPHSMSLEERQALASCCKMEAALIEKVVDEMEEVK